MSEIRTHEEFIEILNKINSNIQVLGKYVNNHTPIKCKCLKDGYEWSTTPSKLINAKHGCPMCGGSAPLTTKIFTNQMKEINPNIIIIGEYINSNTPLDVKCKECGHEWKSRPYHLKSGKGCPICARKVLARRFSKGMEKFREELSFINPNIEVSGEYINKEIKIACKCKICDNKWEATPNNLLAGKGCPKCAGSKGEKRINEWLKEHNFNFFSEYKFQDCFSDRLLPFDFYIPELKIAIEYDGEHHFKPVRFGGISKERAEKNLITCKERDEIKNKYCENNDIKLIRISYLEYKNIPSILEKHLL